MNNFSRNPNQPYNPYAASQSAASSNALIQRVSYLLCTALLVTAGAAYWAASAQLSPALFFAADARHVRVRLRPVVCPEQSRPEPGAAVRPQRSGRTADGAAAWRDCSRLPLRRGGHRRGGVSVGGNCRGPRHLCLGVRQGLRRSRQVFDLSPCSASLSSAWSGSFCRSAPACRWGYAVIGALIFAGFTLYDFSNIKFRYGPNDYVLATVALYLDFINLFWFLVQILLSLSGGSSRRN